MTVTRVLLVEDDRGYARFLREILLEAREAHDLETVDTLEDAVAQLAHRAFDIILLDLGLPDADGTEALTHVASIAPATPIVVLSSHDSLDVALESMRLGAQEYLVKGQAEHVLLPRAMRYAMERKRLQDAAAAARDEAEHANAVKDDFLAMLGHELRNPLAPIVTALSLMRRDERAEDRRELRIVERQVQHVVRLVDDLLDVARIVRGKMELKQKVVDVADLVAAAVETSLPLFEQRRHTLDVDVEPGQLFVKGDPARLGQVIANLLTNAAKYTDPNGAVSLVARADGAHVEVRVRDDGIGMPPELLGRVFGLFEQGSRAIDRSAGGLGLGLAIVRNIVSLHGGTVTAASEGPGKGSEFVVRLPRTLETAAPSPVPAAAAARPATGARRVLIVDDNTDAAEMLDVGLTALGHVTHVVYDGESAVDAVSSFAPDVVLLDIGLPVIDGYEAARRIRAATLPSAPVLVAVTGYGQRSDRQRSQDAGFQEHLVKPIQLTTVDELIRKAPVRAAPSA